jgi:hypothetical protein
MKYIFVILSVIILYSIGLYMFNRVEDNEDKFGIAFTTGTICGIISLSLFLSC